MNSQADGHDRQDDNANDQPQSARPSRPGRPRKLDETQLREICALITAGCGMAGAARYVGCAASTIRREAARNPQFDDDLRRAYLAAELSPLNALRRAAATHWRAAAWFLERTNPQRFARQHPFYLKPEQLRAYAEFFGDMVRQEVTDPELMRRIQSRLHDFSSKMEREAWAEKDALIPEPRNARQRSPRPLPRPWINPRDDDDDPAHAPPQS